MARKAILDNRIAAKVYLSEAVYDEAVKVAFEDGYSFSDYWRGFIEKQLKKKGRLPTVGATEKPKAAIRLISASPLKLAENPQVVMPLQVEVAS